MMFLSFEIASFISVQKNRYQREYIPFRLEGHGMLCSHGMLRKTNLNRENANTTQVIKLFASIRKGNFYSSFGGKRSKTISFVTKRNKS